MAKATASNYVAGVCNINPTEIAARRKVGHIGLIFFAVAVLLLFELSANRWFRIVLFVPAMLAAVGYLQAHYQFCVGYAAAGQQNADGDSLETARSVKAAAKAIDKRRARSINLQSVAIGLVVTAIAVVV